MTLPSADELLTGVSKHAHGSVDGLEDPERRIDWRAVGAGLRHYHSDKRLRQLVRRAARARPSTAQASFFLFSPTTFVTSCNYW